MEGSMTKYIDADRLRAEIEFAKSVYDNPKRVVYGVADAYRQDGRAVMCDDILKKIDSLQQDETQVDKMLCSQVWWEEQGWIMIPPDATIEGIDSLLRQVKKKLQQEQPSLPSNLDEAAEEYVKDYGYTEDDYKRERIIAEEHFKAGAEWMAGQGHTVDGTFHHSCGYPSVIELKTYLRDYEGADVIVQIRKK